MNMHNDADAAWNILARADILRKRIDALPSAVKPYPDEVGNAVFALIDAIAEAEGREVASRAVARWLITKEPIGQCVREEREAQT